MFDNKEKLECINAIEAKLRLWNDIYDEVEVKSSDRARLATLKIAELEEARDRTERQIERRKAASNFCWKAFEGLVKVTTVAVPAGFTYAGAKIQARSRIEEVQLVNESIERCQEYAYYRETDRDEPIVPLTDAGRRANADAIRRR